MTKGPILKAIKKANLNQKFFKLKKLKLLTKIKPQIQKEKTIEIKKKKNGKKKIIEENKENINENKIEIEAENSEDEKQIVHNNNIVPVLTKYLKIEYELPAIYTGGKIIFSQNNKFMLSLANYKIFIYDLETKSIHKKIIHVKY